MVCCLFIGFVVDWELELGCVCIDGFGWFVNVDKGDVVWLVFFNVYLCGFYVMYVFFIFMLYILMINGRIEWFVLIE